MVFKHKKVFSRTLFQAVLIIAGIGFLLSGCATTPNVINPAVSGPQVVVNPDSARLGVAKLMGTDIVFQGSGFQPDDSVFISIAGPDDTEAVVADGRVKPDGTFSAAVGGLAKVIEILRADVIMETYSEDGKYGQILVLTRDPIPTGVYNARVTGLMSDQTAETEFTLAAPSRMDRFKDWMGKKLGKIKDKRT